MTNYLISGIASITYLIWIGLLISFEHSLTNIALTILPSFLFAASALLFLIDKTKAAAIVGLIGTAWITKGTLFGVIYIWSWPDYYPLWKLIVAFVLPFLGIFFLYLINIGSLINPEHKSLNLLPQKIKNKQHRSVIGLIPLASILIILIYFLS